MKRCLKALIALCVSGLILFIIPLRTFVISPAVRVRIIDEAGYPARGVIVAQTCEYITVGSKMHEQILKADDQGYVTFPQRAERISFARLFLGVFRDIVHLQCGYGFGPYARVMAHGEDPYVWSSEYCSLSDPVLKLIRLKRMKVDLYP